ncbi:MAG: M48 family metallopeptidase [Clostridia bacterium]|nr:M48 family metallopeptidase [Clostridia bacterium]
MQNKVLYKDKIIEYTIILSNRKSVGISVSVKNGVRVSAPHWVGRKQIEDIVNQKAEWIARKLEELSERQPASIRKELADDTDLLYLGRILYLKLVEDRNIKKSSLRTAGDMIIITLPNGLGKEEYGERIRKIVVEWYRERAMEVLNERVQIFSPAMGVRASEIKIKQQKTRWGSCSSRGNINFNWKLVMFPLDIIDYVVVHELAHLKVLNHSKKFWEVVGSVMPDYKTREKQLREYARKLDSIE